ncbi:hypothetical protein GGI22_001525 [Coemansia erecta]|nr:hypothetical protein GGI22_001525 [Coemansia erecta]
MTSIPSPLEFILEQGRHAQSRRQRSKSDAALSSDAWNTTATTGRRRNTVGTTTLQFPQTPLTSMLKYPLSPSAATDGCLSPRLSGPHAPCTAVSSGLIRACGHRSAIVSRTTSPLHPADAADALYMGAYDLKEENEDDDEQVMLLTPLSPPMTPEQQQTAPTHIQACSPASSSIMSLPNLSLSAFGLPSSSSVCSDATSLTTEPVAAGDSSITCLVLDNKTIQMARPRLVQISPSLIN